MSCLPGYSERERKLMRALRHYVHRNHEFDPHGCDGCLEAAGFLTVPGYAGSEHPTCVTEDTNIGASTREQLESFWLLVGEQLGLSHVFGWTKAEPSICLGGRILVRESLIGRYPWEGYQEVLHEVAHALCPGDKVHGRVFHDTFATLIQMFLGSGPCGYTRSGGITWTISTS